MWFGADVLLLLTLAGVGLGNVLTPPYINIAEGSKVEATYTCGEGIDGVELYCKLVGANQEGSQEAAVNIIHGQVCDICNTSDPSKSHPPSAAVDGTESYWMSPPLSRGVEYSQLNFTIDLGQEFHVAYVIIKMGISPYPGVWVLEKSSDNGKTYTPWQFFADTDVDCERLFGKETLQPITNDDSVICDTHYSKILPLEDGEIVVSLLNDRPSAHDFFNSPVLQEWTRATNVRLRLLQTKTLYAHVMSFARLDPSVTRRYFYSIRDISIGGRCRCNGHADTCLSVEGSFTRICDCKHNTTGINCERCKDNLVQKKWRQSKSNKVFECEECNCHGHSNECKYNETVDALGLSLDKYGVYEGGGVCQNCQDNTIGINCERCRPGYYRPLGRLPTQKNACERCKCSEPVHTGNCADGTGICECKVNFLPPLCDRCAYGYFGFPTCKNCTCFISGTVGGICEPDSQVHTCQCKTNFAGDGCRTCNEGYYSFPDCKKCDCHPLGSNGDNCNVTSGQCDCRSNYGGLKCDQCAHGFYDFPQCNFCKCDPEGTLQEVCDKKSGTCLCKPGFGGRQCEKCLPGYKDYPKCQPCDCSPAGSSSKVCDLTGKCSCLEKFSGKTCSQCAFGYYKYPECLPCDCETLGTFKNAQSCDDNAQCKCREGVVGRRCDTCQEGLYNFPTCEECNCDPAGVLPNSTDCGELSKFGELCQCKSRVMGRTCKECKPLFWNLQHYNPQGCEECGCSNAGVVSGISVCDTKSGQCLCKKNVDGRQCNTCVDGTYHLADDNIFGCTDCSCDIGGALDNACDKRTGACACRPRITGRNCDKPGPLHYYPTLHQFKYEMEDGTTPDDRPLSYGYEEDVFPGYSWRGYAILTHAQNKVRKQVELENSDNLHYILMRYVNRNDETVPGVILAQHEDEEPIELKIYFKRAFQPDFAFAAGSGNIPVPLVASALGKWDLEITANQSIFIDYLVLIPQSYYEGNILLEEADEPCKRGGSNDCKQYAFPSVDSYDVVYGDSAFVVADGAREEITDFMEDWRHPMGGSKLSKLPELSTAAPEIHLDLRVKNKDPTFLLIDYATPRQSNSTAHITVDIEGDRENYSSNIKLSPCPYTWLCRQALLDQNGKLATFHMTDDFVTVIVVLENEASVGIESVSLVPYNLETAYEYLKPSPVCIIRDSACRGTTHETPLDLKKIEFESGNEDRKANVLPPELYDNNTVLIHLHNDDGMIDLAGKVPSPGNYTFIVHYYQPNHPAFNLDAIVHNGYSYEGKLPLVHCPSSSGCRSVVRRNDGKSIYLIENFLLTLKEPGDKNVWLDYILVVPDSKFSQHLLKDKEEGSIARFVNECSSNFFHADNNTSEFCRSSIFSLTTHYNNGALRCECHPDGAYKLQCEPFGGQCTCKENIIGRRCERCKTGYYNFPVCSPCECHENSLCDETTGQCSCPPNVIGEYCDQCANNTYGYFPQLGCRECECNHLGLEDGNLQCDATFGTCNCKENVVGRQCDKCAHGYYYFPECLKCDCDPRGTTSEICDSNTGQCLCKEYVESEGCDICREGSFNIQAGNRQGCSKCFCFDHSKQCTSAPLYKSSIENIENWNISSITVKKPVIEINNIGKAFQVPNDPYFLGLDLSDEQLQNKNVYFSAPPDYLGNRLTSYGGFISYTIFTTSVSYVPMDSAPVLILVGANFHLLHYSSEVPADDDPFPVRAEITESNFILSNTFLPPTRAQLMQVLRDLRAIYIKATYWENGSTTRLSQVFLDSTSDEYSDRGQALSVEKCLCEPQYTGLSCEDCAPGYHRSQFGSYGGNCVPCQCHGHAAACDVNTGICIDCQHNTTGDHCEMCAEGFHGDARNGSPYDCLICACPLPILSNNFARSCEFSNDGESISCECKEGYFGSLCQSCAAGYYGDPTREGDGECKPCDCSGNIDPSAIGSCDSRTGECLQCLHNTYGDACGLCAPFYFGDAVYSKNCQSCVCDTCGSQRCNDKTGECECQPNVTGERCDSCIPDHYGLHSCQGCQPCDCKEASESSQCNLETGNCKCKPGVTGRTCDRCEHGYWNYTSEGCTQCSCNIGYSIGVGCNPDTGECECLPGVIGEKCDHCPHRWVLNPSEGCLACDKCIDDLLDTMDVIHNKFVPFASDFTSFNESFFTRQRVLFINQTVNNLRPNVSELDKFEVNFVPIKESLTSITDDIDKLIRKVEYIDGKTNNSMDANLIEIGKNTGAIVEEALGKASSSVDEVLDIAENLKSGAVTKYGYSGSEFDEDLRAAQEILENLKSSQLTYTEDKIREKELARAEALLQEMKKVMKPVNAREAGITNMSNRIEVLESKISDLKSNSVQSLEKGRNLRDQIKKYREHSLPEKYKVISTLEGVCYGTLKYTDMVLNSTVQLLASTSTDVRQYLIDNQTLWEDLHDKASLKVGLIKNDFDELSDVVERAIMNGIRLEEQGSELKRLQSEYQHDTNAVQAYKSIVNTMRDAMIAADEAKRTAEIAADKSQGIGDRAIGSSDTSTSLLNGGISALNLSQIELGPQLSAANQKLDKLTEMKIDMEADLEKFKSSFKKAEEAMSTVPNTESISEAEEAKLAAAEVQNRIRGIVEELPNRIVIAKQIRTNTKDREAAISEASVTIKNVLSIVPDMKVLSAKLNEHTDKNEGVSLDLRSKLDDLKAQINRARELANTIKIGITMYPNATLQLRNPSKLPEQGINNEVSLYFNTTEQNGLIFFLGNEVQSRRKKRLAETGDFMALEIENGNPKLTVDLGSGPTSLICNLFVANGQWYFSKVQRTGKSLTLSVTLVGNPKASCTKEAVMAGNTAVLNLDKKSSKLFAGGLPSHFKAPSVLNYNTFVGLMDELRIDGQLVGFWNFEEAENLLPAKEREVKERTSTPTGFRFNGDGYVVLNSTGWQLGKQSEILFRFKTFAKEGLLFLAPNGPTFLSVELREGRVLFQFDLGRGPLVLHTPKTYNDGEWHSVEAARYENQGSLKIDGIIIDHGQSSGDVKRFETPEKVFMGGFPGEHNIAEVIESDFDGCIDEVRIDGQSVDLDKNLEAAGLIPGCPPKFAAIVSFEPGSRGYVMYPNASAHHNTMELILRFKTGSADGLIAYADYVDASASLSLSSGQIIFRVGKDFVSTQSTTGYNDSTWHVVMATYNLDSLQIFIDDHEQYRTFEPPSQPIRMLHGQLYFGGVPSKVNAEAALSKHFSGCISDATFNGMIVNFGNLTEIPNAIIGKCLEGGRRLPPHRPPTLPPPKIPLVEKTTTAKIDHLDKENAIPFPEPTVARPDHMPQCKVPLYPSSPMEEVEFTAYKIGTAAGSRLEYPSAKIRHKYEFSIDVKTAASDGLIFYTSDQRHVDFVAVYLQEGQVNYRFNCGSGAAHITSTASINDQKWHNIKFSRQGNQGLLTVDSEIFQGNSAGNAKTMNVESPFFIGGLDPSPLLYSQELYNTVIFNVKGINNSLDGCVKDFKHNNQLLEKPSKFHVTACDTEYDTVYFSPDGGYVKLFEKFRIGKRFEVMMELRPRALSGVLLSVHSKDAFLVLELINGELRMNVDTGNGEYTSTFRPTDPYLLCDGQWHTATGVKALNTLTTAIDGAYSKPTIHTSKHRDKDTRHTLYLGGHPNIRHADGILSKTNYVGCIRNLIIKTQNEKIDPRNIVGNVTGGVCPD